MAGRELRVTTPGGTRRVEEDGAAGRLVALGRALSDPIRVRMLGMMAEGRSCCGPLPGRGVPADAEEGDIGICVCEFEEHFGMGQSKVSYHVKKLKEAGLVREQKRGRWSFYSLNGDVARELLGEAAGHLGIEGTNAYVGLARGEDLPAVLALLEGSGLPKEGLREHLATTLIAREGERVVGSAALEIHGASALLRSVAVAGERRGEGLGGRLTREALGLARERGAERAYLLTETADGFFSRFGFRPIPRGEAPEGVRGSVEFVSACPRSARAMVTQLPEGTR